MAIVGRRGQELGCFLPLLLLAPEVVPVLVVNQFFLFHFLELHYVLAGGSVDRLLLRHNSFDNNYNR